MTSGLTALPDHHVTTDEIAERLRRHAHHARGAVAENSARALKADSAVFSAWCSAEGQAALPAAAETVARFIDVMGEVKAPATVRRYVSSISTLHKAAGLDSPTIAMEVNLALRRLARAKGARQQQAAPLNRRQLDIILHHAGNRTIERRDAAMLALAYDTLTRRSELVALQVKDFAQAGDGSATILIRKGKTDQEAAGSVRFVASDTSQLVRAWIKVADLAEGPLFRAVSKAGSIGGPLKPGEVARIIKRAAARAGIDGSRLSGHSTRVGAAQDQVGAGIGLAEVMQAGGWKTPVMVARYSERLLARNSGSAKLAALQGR